MNENKVWTDSQDYGADEILYTSKITLLYKTTRFTSEIITLFRVSPQLFKASHNWQATLANLIYIWKSHTANKAIPPETLRRPVLYIRDRT